MTKLSGKVTVSREVAEAIEYVNGGYDAETTIRFKSQDYLFKGDVAPLNDINLDTLIRALYIGYEVEKTPEELLAESIRLDIDNLRVSPFGKYNDYYSGRVDGARKAAEILGVKLPERTDAN
ncbi:hypothetical protein [Terribacillus saccharophilus]|uniref:hypothetical protein n=1 Tax=Terribacillus saccharophilus TaxID=361277 RepID=UPI003D29E478